MASLLEEFEIHPITKPLFTLAGHPISFTNSSLFMMLAILAATALMVLAMRPRATVPGRWQMLAEKLYNMVDEMVEDNASHEAAAFFPLIFSIFVFILFCNIFGMFPHSLAVTSHILINLAIALFLFLIIIITGFARHGVHFFSVFVPPGVPLPMLFFMVPIELFSFLLRPFSLSIRLFANMLAGHILLGVFAGMTATLVAGTLWLKGVSLLPLLVNIAITGFEFFVAFLQAYIYAVLASVYLRDAVELHADP
jgi:F-type H+-transporting ATPase subunit a